MRVLKIFIISILIFANLTSANTLYAQSMGRSVSSSNSCKPLSQAEVDEINHNIQQLLDSIYVEKLKSVGMEFEIENDNNTGYVKKNQNNNWRRKIFTDNFELGFILEDKYKDYTDILYAQNWKSSPYGNLSATEISNIINTLSNEIYEELKQNPFYKSDNSGDIYGEIGMVLVDLVVFILLAEYAAAALGSATTVTQFSAISGFSWDFSTLFSSPSFLTATTKFGRIGSTLIGWGASVSVLNNFHDLIREYILDIPKKENMALGTQQDLHSALKHKFDLDKQIKEIQNNTQLTEGQKQKRIETRYKEAIIKIYALDYVKTYLTYAEKPEKYFWALLDLTTLLQSRELVNLCAMERGAIKVEPLPRLVERTPEMQETLANLTRTYISGYLLEKHADNMKRKVEERALRNFESANIHYDFNYK